MTTLTHAAPVSASADASQRTARIIGWLFLATYVTAISAKVFFYAPLFDNADYIVSSGADTRVVWGALCEILLVTANIGTAVLLFPLLRRQHEGLALGFVAARILECVFIVIGILSVLTVVTLRQDLAADSAGLSAVGHVLLALQEWTFWLGPGLTVGVGNGLLLGFLMLRSGLVPRRLAVLGVVGGAGICLSGVAVVLGLIANGSPLQLLASVPEFFWELGLGIYLVRKGFAPSRLTTPAVGG